MVWADAEVTKAWAANRWKSRREFINKVKAVPCADCGDSYPPYVMDFDHVVGEKRGNIATMINGNWDRLMDEIAKCDIVCSNCHRIRTYYRSINKGIDLIDNEDCESA